MNTVTDTKTKKILTLLKEKRTVTNFELNNICYRYAARIYELRADGYRIVSVHVKDGLWKFVFKGHEDDEPAHVEYDHGD